MMKFAILSGLVLSASCMVLHQPQIPLHLGLQYHDTPNYNFAYEVNDAHTGDIKSQHETRRGETVLGQYSLLQPDGIRRTVDYRADEHAGFRATVNNDGRNPQQLVQPQASIEAQRSNSVPSNLGDYYWPAPTQHGQPQANIQQQANIEAQGSNSVPSNHGAYYWPTPTQSPTPAPAVAISRSSIVQTFSHGNHNPWV